MSELGGQGNREEGTESAHRAADLGPRIVQGGLWVIGSQGIAAGGSALGMLVLAAFLDPREFGLVAIATLTVNAATSGLAVGLRQLTQTFDMSRELERTAISFALAAGLMSLGAVLFAAPFIARLLGDPEATSFIRALSFVILARRVTEVRGGILERDLRFDVNARAQIAATVCGLVVGTVLGLMRAGAWALVGMLLTMEIITAVALMSYPHGERMPGFDRPSFRRIRRFGREMAANSVAVFAFTNFDDAVVARLAGTSPLGAYSFMFNVANAPTYMMTRAASRVLLPLLRHLRGDQEKISQVYLRTIRILAFSSGIVMFWLLVHGPAALNVLFQGRWSSGYGALRILSVYGLIRSVAAISGSVFLSVGRPELVRRITQWQTVLMFAVIIPAVHLGGISGAALSVTIPLVIGGAYALGLSGQIVGAPRRRILVAVTKGWVVAAIINLTGAIAWLLTGFSALLVSIMWMLLFGLWYSMIEFPAELALLRRALPRRSS